jgi:hypothetical protein
MADTALSQSHITRCDPFYCWNHFPFQDLTLFLGPSYRFDRANGDSATLRAIEPRQEVLLKLC